MNFKFWKKGESHSQFFSQEGGQTVYEEVQPEEVPEVVREPRDPNSGKIYTQIIQWALYIGAFLLPLFFLPVTTGILDLNKQMLLITVAGVGLVAWLLGIVSSGWLSWRNNYLNNGVIAVLAATLLGTLFSLVKFKSLFGVSISLSNSLVSIFALTVLYFLAVNNFNDRGKKLRSVFELSLVVTFVYGLLQIFGVHLIGSVANSQAFNTVGSLNALGLLAAVSLPLFSKSKIYLKWLDRAYLEKVGFVAALLLLFILNWWVLWTITIAGMVAMIVFENLGGGKFRIANLLLPMTVIVLGVFLMVVDFNLSALKANLPVEISPSFKISTDIAGGVLKEKLVFGYGPENFSLAFDKYGAKNLATTNLANVRFSDSASEIINWVIGGGVVAAVALLCLLLCIGRALWKFRRNYFMGNESEDPAGDAAVLSVLTALVVGLFLYPFNLTAMFSLYLFMALAVLVLWNKESRDFNIEDKMSLSLVSSLGFIAGLILVLVGIYFGSTIYIADAKYSQALKESDKSKAAGLLVEAINWNGQDERYFRSASQVALNLLASEVSKPASADRNSKIQNYTTTAVNLAKSATEVGPLEAGNWENLGTIYQNLITFVEGVDVLAENAYLRAVELRPGDATIYNRIGSMYLTEAELLRRAALAGGSNAVRLRNAANLALDKSEDNFKRAVEFSSNFGLAIYNLGLVYERQGRVIEAIAQIEKILPANANQPALLFELALLYYRANQKDNAVAALERALVLAPDYANARWYLGLIYEERGNLDGAIAQMEGILSVEVNKGNSLVTKKLEELKNGQRAIPPEKVLDQQPL